MKKLKGKQRGYVLNYLKPILRPLYHSLDHINFYYSLILFIKSKFKKIFIFKNNKLLDNKDIKISKCIVYDRIQHNKFIFLMPYRSKFLLSEIFCNTHYLLCLDEIKKIISERFSQEKFSILDLGANIGTFSIVYYYIFNSSIKPYLYLFEPLLYNLRFFTKKFGDE